VRSTLSALDHRPLVTAAVAELRRPVGGCLVNHDLKWDNVVLTGPAQQPVLLDWELAGLGDPAWDLGCLLAEHLVRDEQLDDPARALLTGYREGAGLRAEIVVTFARRVVLAAGLRIVQLALEVAYTPYAGDGAAVARLTERAEAVLAAPVPLTEEVVGCLS
jgi:aminoglycoside phosphotransferase (APT) family kinase protein